MGFFYADAPTWYHVAFARYRAHGFPYLEHEEHPRTIEHGSITEWHDFT